MSDKKYLIVIGGATASGKTGVAISLAQRYGIDILSCDSRQFYQEMEIGTAKPTPEERSQATHHFVNSLSIQEAYTVGDYEKEALQLLKELYKTKDAAIIVGGSGLFIKAVCEGLDEFPDVPEGIRESLEQLLEQEGITSLQNKLKEVDPIYYDQVDLQNPHRLIRALSVYEASGKPFSSFRKDKTKERFFEPLYFQMTWEREALYDRINRRVDIMMEEGLLEEVRSLLEYRQLGALRTVGYQEFFDYFDGNISLEEAVELVKRNSRRYAKRQMTWFRRDAHWTTIHPPTDMEKLYEAIDAHL